MRHYELMVIMDPTTDEKTVEPTMKKYLEQVLTAKGSVDTLDVWGKRRLAYPILKHTDGIYVVVTMQTTSEVALEMNRQMNLNESILRTKLLRTDN